MTLEQDIKDIEYDLNEIMFKLKKNIQGIKDVANSILTRSRALKALDENAVQQFQDAVYQVFSFKTEDDAVQLMPLAKEEIIAALEVIKNKLAQQERTIGKPFEMHSDYKKVREKYASYITQIEKLEFEIRTRQEFYDKKLNEPLKHSKKYKGWLHARLTDNLRVIYDYDEAEDKIFFRNILTHDEMDKS